MHTNNICNNDLNARFTIQPTIRLSIKTLSYLKWVIVGITRLSRRQRMIGHARCRMENEIIPEMACFLYNKRPWLVGPHNIVTRED